MNRAIGQTNAGDALAFPPACAANVSTSEISPRMSNRISEWSQSRLVPSTARLTAEQRGAGFEEFLRIDCFAVDAGLVMQMRAGRAPRRAQASDHLADANALPDLDVDFRQVAVTGGKPVAVIDLHHLPAAAPPPSP